MDFVPRIYDAYVCFHGGDGASASSDVLNENVTYGYVMEKLDTTLFDYLSSPSTTDLSVLKVGKQLQNCFTKLDEHLILHRDLHLKNIMVKFDASDQPKVFIIDFGNAYDRHDAETVLKYTHPLEPDSTLDFYQTYPAFKKNLMWFDMNVNLMCRQETNNVFWRNLNNLRLVVQSQNLKLVRHNTF